MNFGTFAGPGTGVPAGSISRYIQTPTITSSQTIAVPPGTQRIEALLCGGGGSGGGFAGGGGGFGGAAIMEIPITGSPLQVVIGAGGVSSNNGSPTYIVSAGTRYAEVGGGGGGGAQNTIAGSGRSGGGGGGGSTQAGFGFVAGTGGCPPIGNMLWCIYPTSGPNTRVDITGSGGAYSFYATAGCGMRSDGRNPGLDGSFGGGGGGGQFNIGAGAGGGGGGGNSSGLGAGGTAGNFGGGGGGDNNATGSAGGSLTSATSVWGYSGFTNGIGANNCGGGGGGLLSAGSNGNSSIGGDGGNGGGGGGGGSGGGGAGGNGFAAIRFYL